MSLGLLRRLPAAPGPLRVSRLFICLAGLWALAGPGSAAAQDGGRPCKKRSPEARVQVALKAGQKVKDLVAWASSITCERATYAKAVGELELSLTLEGELPARSVPAVFALQLDAAGLEVKDLGQGPEVVRKAGSATSGVRRGPCAPTLADELSRAVRSRGDDLDVEASLVEGLVAERHCLSSSARLAADARGLFWTAVEPGSFFAALGLKDGDRLLALNQQPLAGIAQARARCAALKPTSRLTLGIERQGKPKALVLTLRNRKAGAAAARALCEALLEPYRDAAAPAAQHSAEKELSTPTE